MMMRVQSLRLPTHSVAGFKARFFVCSLSDILPSSPLKSSRWLKTSHWHIAFLLFHFDTS